MTFSPNITLGSIDITQMLLIKQNIDDPFYRPAHNALLDRCTEYLTGPVYSVVDKELCPPSGDKHDYMSVGPYWWPDPTKKDGLPWISKDGVVNPQTNSNGYDGKRSKQCFTAIYELALAYFFTEQLQYAHKVTKLLSTWFIDPATKMNPNMKFAQGVPGLKTGSGIGLIDVCNHFTLITDSLRILDGYLESHLEAELRQWFSDYLDWVLSSEHGEEEKSQLNNHGSFYELHVVSLAQFLGRSSLVRERLTYTQDVRLGQQLKADGTQPLELVRTKPYQYSAYNMNALSQLAFFAARNNLDMWHKPNLPEAVRFLAAYIVSPEKFPYAGIHPPAFEDALIAILSRALSVYRIKNADPIVLAIREGYEQAPTLRGWLLWHVKEYCK